MNNKNPKMTPFFSIKSAFATLWGLLTKETFYEGTSEADAFEEALEATVIEYLKFYDISLKKLETGGIFTRIEALANELVKREREFNDLSNEEKEFLKRWLEVLRTNYSKIFPTV